jgi:hypothetical protein
MLSGDVADAKIMSPSFSAGLAGPASRFGTIHDLACAPQPEHVFYCKVGLTFMEEDRPIYRQTNFRFSRVRQTDGNWALTLYLMFPPPPI